MSVMTSLVDLPETQRTRSSKFIEHFFVSGKDNRLSFFNNKNKTCTVQKAMLATKTEIKIKQCVLHGAVHSLFLLYIHMHTHTPSLSEITSTVTLSLPFHTQHMHTAEYILRG